jgi:hypothetical protein
VHDEEVQVVELVLLDEEGDEQRALFGKYRSSDPTETSASSVVSLVVAAAYPCSSKMRAAGSRMRSTVRRDRS